MQNRYTLCSILYDTHDNRRKKRENPFRETHQKSFQTSHIQQNADKQTLIQQQGFRQLDNNNFD